LTRRHYALALVVLVHCALAIVFLSPAPPNSAAADARGHVLAHQPRAWTSTGRPSQPVIPVVGGRAEHRLFALSFDRLALITPSSLPAPSKPRAAAPARSGAPVSRD